MKRTARWATQNTDQRIAIDILRRHCEQSGYVKFLENVRQIGPDDGGRFEVEFPAWVHELTARFDELYGPDRGHAVYLKVVEWLVREIFRGQAAVSIQ